MIRLQLPLGMCFLLILQTPVLALQEGAEPRVTFPEAGVSLAQPSGFEKATAFHGFQQTATGASVLVAAIPGPYSEVTRGFNKSQMSAQGMTLISKENIRIEDHDGLLLQVRQSAYGQEFQKWMVVFGDANHTRIVTGSFPLAHEEALSKVLKETVLGARLDAASSAGPAPLPFSIGTVAGLSSVKKVASLGKMAAFTKDGNIPVASPSDPMFFVAPSLGEVPVGDRKALATKRLHALAATQIDSIASTNPVTIDQLDGFEILAAGKEPKSGTAVAVFQVMLFPEDGGYILMTGLVGQEHAETYLPKFKTLAESFKHSPR